MKKILTFTTYLSFLFLLLQCKKSDLVSGNNDVNTSLQSKDPIVVSIHGIILDENKLGISGASVKIGSASLTTDSKGYFRMENATLDRNASVVVVEKSGYFKSLRSFSATSGGNFVSIQMIKKSLAGNFSAASGGTVTLPNGGTVTFGGNSVVKASDKTAHAGNVKLYAAYIDPTDPAIADNIPGSFMANDKDGRRVTLESFGMIAVEMQSDAGEKLQIANTSTATIAMPIPSSLLGAAPATINLWYLNEDTGIWQEDGTASKQGNQYRGNVKHFSFWNYDINVPTIKLDVTIKDGNGTPLTHVRVKVKSATSGAVSYGWTDTLGQVSGLVPANVPLTLSVLDKCGGSAYQQIIGPFSVNTILPAVTITNSVSTSITFVTGRLVDCNNLPVTKGTAIVVYNNVPRYLRVNSNGEFSVSLIYCAGGNNSCSITGINENAGGQQGSKNVGLTPVTTTAGDVMACGNPTLQFMDYVLDGNNYYLTNLLQFGSPNGSGFSSGISSQQSNSAPMGHTVNFSYLVTDNTIVGGVGSWSLTSIWTDKFKNTTILLPTVVNITQTAPAIGDYYEGNFSVVFRDTLQVTHNMVANFRKRRVF